MPLLFAAVNAGTLLRVAWVSLLAGAVSAVLFSLVVLGSARSAEASREGRAAAATAFGALAIVALIATGAGVVYGIQIMLHKG